MSGNEMSSTTMWMIGGGIALLAAVCVGLYMYYHKGDGSTTTAVDVHKSNKHIPKNYGGNYSQLSPYYQAFHKQPHYNQPPKQEYHQSQAPICPVGWNLMLNVGPSAYGCLSPNGEYASFIVGTSLYDLNQWGIDRKNKGGTSNYTFA